MAERVSTFLMFEGKAEEAARAYADLFGVEIEGLERRDDGKVQAASLTIAGQRIMLFDSPVHHEFTFTPAISLFVECDSEAEVDRLAEALGEGGAVMMPLQTYDFARRFTWLEDRFGVSWQLRLA
jgi:predicted 3-demethylubiquinone-9 3-methyltransferase (glyoxalase superfamily)